MAFRHTNSVYSIFVTLSISVFLNSEIKCPYTLLTTGQDRSSNCICVSQCVHENKILRRIFGPRKHENGQWRRLHNEELHSLYRSPNIVMVIKSRRLRWAGQVARMEEGKGRFQNFSR